MRVSHSLEVSYVDAKVQCSVTHKWLAPHNGLLENMEHTRFRVKRFIFIVCSLIVPG